MLYTDGARLADRRSFCASLGLDPAKKLVTYAGEDPVIAPDAPMYVDQIHRLISQGRLSQPAQLLVRPHPQDDPRRFDAVRSLPGVAFDLPGQPSDRYWMDMSRDDLRRLYETMKHSDVVVNVTSTIVLDAALFDTPSICIGYGFTHSQTYFNSPMRYFEMDHYKYIMDAGATRVVESEGQLLDALNMYLETPRTDSDGRRRIAREIGEFDDGRSAERTAAAIIAALRPEAAHAEARNMARTPPRARAI
jgi:CDP-glycerol glycerophosphotransferase (TagB/SpsB family)